LRHDIEVVLQGQQFTKTIAKDWMIVSHHDTDLGCDTNSRARRGSVYCGVIFRHTLPARPIVWSHYYQVKLFQAFERKLTSVLMPAAYGRCRKDGVQEGMRAVRQASAPVP